MSIMKTPNRSDPMHMQVGGDADIDGIAQTITSQDIQALLVSDAPVDERLQALKGIRAELEARLAADMGNEMAPVLQEADAAIAQLAGSDQQSGATTDFGSASGAPVE